MLPVLSRPTTTAINRKIVRKKTLLKSRVFLLPYFRGMISKPPHRGFPLSWCRRKLVLFAYHFSDSALQDGFPVAYFLPFSEPTQKPHAGCQEKRCQNPELSVCHLQVWFFACVEVPDYPSHYCRYQFPPSSWPMKEYSRKTDRTRLSSTSLVPSFWQKAAEGRQKKSPYFMRRSAAWNPAFWFYFILAY